MGRVRGIFISFPVARQANTLPLNSATGALARYTGWDATCWIRCVSEMFFGTQNGIIMQADRTGYDDGLPYVARWSVAGTASRLVADHHLAAGPGLVLRARRRAFLPQLTGTVDYTVVIPSLPPRTRIRHRPWRVTSGISACGTRRYGTPVLRRSRSRVTTVRLHRRHRLFARADYPSDGGATSQAECGVDFVAGTFVRLGVAV